MPGTSTQLQLLRTLELTWSDHGSLLLVNEIDPKLPPEFCRLIKLQRLSISLYDGSAVPELLLLTGLTQLRISDARFRPEHWAVSAAGAETAAAESRSCCFTALPHLAELSIKSSKICGSLHYLGIQQ